MNIKRLFRRGVLVVAVPLLAAVAWGSLTGGLHQLPKAQTFGQRVETGIQFVCSLLSIAAVVVCFWWRRWAPAVRRAWAVSLAITGGLSALVWGPPMPAIALVFGAATLLVALGINWVLRWAQGA